MEFLSLQEAISVAKRELRVNDTLEHDDLLTAWADEAVRHMNDPDSTFTHRVVLDVEDGNKVCLPKGYQTLVGIGFWKNDETCDCLLMDYFIGWNKCYNNFNLQGNWIIFNQCVQFTRCTVVYEGWHKDCQGFMYMTETQERGVRAYLRWRFKAMYPEKYRENPWQNDRDEYRAQKAYCKGQTAIKKFRENKFAINQILHRTELRMWNGSGYNYTWG